MPAEIVLQQSAEEMALQEKREQLATVRSRLAEREADLLHLQAQLQAFESRYMRQVGVLYAELDEVEAHLMEREAEMHRSEDARRRAEEARQRARESHQAAYGAEEEAAAEEFDPPPNLKALFRELAKRIHPDLARDEAEQRYLHLLMARANQAYRRGDAEVLARMLDDHRELTASVAGESAAAEMLRIARQIRHAERDLSGLEYQHRTLLSSEIAQLFGDAEAAASEHRDLLAELATKLREQIAEAQDRFEAMDQQASAHER